MPLTRQRNLLQQARLYAPAAILLLIGFAVAYQFVEPAPPLRLRIAAGEADGAYTAHASAYADYLARHGVTLEIRQTAGSIENLQLLRNGEVEAGFVQGGTADPADSAGLLSLGSLYYEPLWLFYRGSGSKQRFADLAGSRIAIGPEGSGTEQLARILLQDTNAVALGITTRTLANESAIAALTLGEIDALITVAGPKSAMVSRLMANPEVQLMDMRRATAYSRLHPYLSALLLPEGVLDLHQDLPPRDIHLIAPTANLVVTPGTHPALVDLLMQAAASVHGKPGWFAERDEFPAPRSLVFELHPEAERFYKHGPPLLQRYLPFWAATLVDRLKVLLVPLVMLLLPLMKIMPPLYQWRMRARIYRWYRELEAVEAEARKPAGQNRAAEWLAELDRIESEVARVSVPLSFAGQAYDLRMHVAMVRDRLEAQS